MTTPEPPDPDGVEWTLAMQVELEHLRERLVNAERALEDQAHRYQQLVAAAVAWRDVRFPFPAMRIDAFSAAPQEVALADAVDALERLDDTALSPNERRRRLREEMP